MFIQVGRGFGKASDLLDPYQIARLQKVGDSSRLGCSGGILPFLMEGMKLERLRGRLALYQHPLAIETMCRFPIPASNSRAKACMGCTGSHGDFDTVGYHLDIFSFTAMSSSSSLD